MIVLYCYPELFGVADNNGYGLKVFAFMRLAGVPFSHEHIFDASAAPRGQLPYIIDDGEPIGDSEIIIAHLISKYRLTIDTNLTAQQRDTSHLITRMLDDLYHRDVAAGPFYGYNRPGAKASEAVIQNWWRQGMMGGAKAHYDGIVAFSQTDFTEDLKKITAPVLVMHSEDDQIVPYVAAGPLSAKLLKNGTLKTYKDLPHGMPTTHAETVNAELLAFLNG